MIVIFSNFEIKLVDYLLLLFQGNGWTVHHTDMVWHQQVYEPWKVTLTGLPLSVSFSLSLSLCLFLSLSLFERFFGVISKSLRHLIYGEMGRHLNTYARCKK